MEKLTIRKPDDFHVHLRQGEMLRNVVDSTSGVFRRAVAMGNLSVPVMTGDDAVSYRSEIMASAGNNFQSILTVMLVKRTTPEIVEAAYNGAGVKVLKLIPGQTSTGSDQGVSLYELEKYYPVLEKAQSLGMVFSVHLELAVEENGEPIALIERERRAIPILKKLTADFPNLKIAVEHATTRELVEAVKTAGPNVAAGLTYHHAVLTYDEVINKEGKIIDAFKYCMPVPKTDDDRRAVIEAMTSGNPKFFFGSDSAPHPIEKKQSDNPPAGVFSAPVIMPGLAEIFEKEGKLERLEDFVSRFGAEFYGLPLNTGRLELIKGDWIAPEIVGNVKVFRGGETLKWRIA